MRRSCTIAVLSLLTSALSEADAQPRAPEGELRRRAMFGAQLAEVTADVRARQKLIENGGVTLVQIFPGTSAADAQFKAGDVMRASTEPA